MFRNICFATVALLLIVSVSAQKIHYDISFPNIIHHEAQITVTLTGGNTASTVFRMSRSSPGRYATHEFAKNVYHVSAKDESGKPLVIDRFNTDEYSIPGKHSEIALSYTLFGHYADGTYADIDVSAVLLNMPASMMWIKGYEKVPIDISFHLPAGSNWTIATQLFPGANEYSFTAPDLQYLMDSPVLMGDLIWRQWQVQNPDKKIYEIRLAINAGPVDSERVDKMADNVKKIVAEAQDLFGELPAYDNSTYTFLYSANPYMHGDGMEHRNSTCITRGAAFSETQLNTFAHEFFHSWNVERIRPADIEPFDFTRSDMSDALWFAEGFTQYYGRLLMVRAGLAKSDFFAMDMAQWVNAKNASPGGMQNSPVEMSRYAVFADAATSIDVTNKANVFSSYYSYGAAISLALDLELRSRFNTSLDVLMQQMWLQFGKKGIPYQLKDIQKVLAGISNETYAESFFTRFIYGHEFFDYEPLLKPYGFFYDAEKTPWIGDIKMSDHPSANGLMLENPSLVGSPLYEAGIDMDDIITKVDGQKILSTDDLSRLLGKHTPGVVLSVEYFHRGEQKMADVKVATNPRLNLVSSSAHGIRLSPAEEKLRAKWFGTPKQ